MVRSDYMYWVADHEHMHVYIHAQLTDRFVTNIIVPHVFV